MYAIDLFLVIWNHLEYHNKVQQADWKIDIKTFFLAMVIKKVVVINYCFIKITY